MYFKVFRAVLGWGWDGKGGGRGLFTKLNHTQPSKALEKMTMSAILFFTVPPPPSIRYHLSTATTIIVIFETLSGHFTIDQYCCMWNRTTVSGTHLPTAPTITCSNVTSIVLDNLDEDSTYTLIGFAFNTAMDNSSHSTPFNLTTKPAGELNVKYLMNMNQCFHTGRALSATWRQGKVREEKIRASKVNIKKACLTSVRACVRACMRACVCVCV